MTTKSRSSIFCTKKCLKNNGQIKKRPGYGLARIFSANSQRRITFLAQKKSSHWDYEQAEIITHKTGSILVSKWIVL